MRFKALYVAIIIVVLIVPFASAQMGGGTGGGRMPGMGVRGAMPSGGMLASDMMELPVAADGTVFVVRKASTGSSYDLAAISPTGTVRWTYPLDSRGMSFAAISGSTLILSSMQTSISGMMPPSTTSQLLGISVASGSKLWTLDLAGGVPMGITVTSDGFYTVVFTMQPSITRKLMSVGNDGKVRWSLNLD